LEIELSLPTPSVRKIIRLPSSAEYVSYIVFSDMRISKTGSNTSAQHALGQSQLPSLHCTVIVFVLDWESHKSLKHDRECLIELLERACFQPHAIQRLQLAEVGWESDNKGFEGKRLGGLY